MKTIIIASMFCMDNFLPILLVVLGAGLLGWLLKKYTGGGSSSANNEWESKYNAITADLAKEKERSAKLSVAANKKSNKSDNNNTALGAAAVVAVGATAAEVESLHNKIKNLKEEVKASNEAKLKIEAEVNAANSRAKEATTLNSELETSKVRIEGLAKALDASKAEAEKFKSDFENANGERTRLLTQLNSSDTGAMQKRIDKLEKDLDSARMTSSNLQVEIDRYKNGPKTISQVAAPKAEKTDEFSREKVKALETELMVLKANQERVDKATELNKLAINAAVNEANAKNSAEIIELRSRIKFAEATINKLEDDKTKLAMAVGNTSVKVKEVEPIEMAAAIEAPKPVEAAPVVEEPKVEEAPVTVAEPIVEEAPIVEIKHDDLTEADGIDPKLEN
ncbi:MAG: hypothetical protein RLZZ118_105 [Bacteroidota bacterium]|jgi:predicted RNase H-like nuclease (RuvC/YqgF family)